MPPTCVATTAPDLRFDPQEGDRRPDRHFAIGIRASTRNARQRLQPQPEAVAAGRESVLGVDVAGPAGARAMGEKGMAWIDQEWRWDLVAQRLQQILAGRYS